MKDYQQEFIDLALKVKALSFGEFTLKSGRLSPYFFNAGSFNTSAHLATLGRIYAKFLQDNQIEFDLLYGPAYKGIPLVCATSVQLYNDFQIEVPYAFNRKEAKTHGEGGSFVGAPIKGKVMIVDDVITAGTAIRESIQAIRSMKAEVAGVLVLVDRQERGLSAQTQTLKPYSAIEELAREQQVNVHSIIKLDDIIHYLLNSNNTDKDLVSRLESYREQYGTKPTV